MRRPPILLLIALTAMWLLLNNTLAPAHLLLGGALALLMLYGFRAVRPALTPLPPRLRRPRAVLLLFGRLARDIPRSNLAVARIVLGLTGGRRISAGFVDVPLDMRDPRGLAALATIVTSTPGTVWVDLAADSSAVTLHVLDLHDRQYWIDIIKNRYERPLMEIFE